MESFAANSPFATYVHAAEKVVVGTEESPPPAPKSEGDAESQAASDKAAAAAEDTDAVVAENEEKTSATQVTKKTENKEPKDPPKQEALKEEADAAGDAKPIRPADLESFMGVHEAANVLANMYHKQLGEYLISYVDNWERVVSQRIEGLLIHYRELQENAEHYQKKMGGLLEKKAHRSNIGTRLASKLDRNEIKEMGAIEARDTVGEHLYLYIEEVMERAWRDVFPLLLRACRFEADFSATEAKVLSNLLTVADSIQVMGEDEDCNIMGRLEDLEKKHPEEVYTEENPFVKLTPLKKKGKQMGDASSVESGSVVEDVHVVGSEESSESQKASV